MAAVRAELAAGRKQSHWMWFVFPQLAGLGHSPMARFYAIGSAAEARAFLAHPVLGGRLRELTGLAIGCRAPSARLLFGSPDDLKFRSCMTLFAAIGDPGEPFRAALDRFFSGERDPATLAALASRPMET